MTHRESVEIRNAGLKLLSTDLLLKKQVIMDIKENNNKINEELKPIVELEDEMNAIIKKANELIIVFFDESGKLLEDKKEEFDVVKVEQEVLIKAVEKNILDMLECTVEIDFITISEDNFPEVIPAYVALLIEHYA